MMMMMMVVVVVVVMMLMMRMTTTRKVITAIFLKDTLDAASNDAEHLVVVSRKHEVSAALSSD